MSMEATCKFCGQPAGIRINFVDKETEAEYHKNYICDLCEISQ